jgi:Na+/melibiose symporter-like transporter
MRQLWRWFCEHSGEFATFSLLGVLVIGVVFVPTSHFHSQWQAWGYPTTLAVLCAIFGVSVIGIIFRLWTRDRDGHRHSERLCSACGYDLRASKDRCPECGLAIANSNDKPQSGR